ncbi:TPA: hypothetical protein QBZ90_002352, partial [Pasteurella multocida]|nr:hypothetical protein [Pasteurella multocida]
MDETNKKILENKEIIETFISEKEESIKNFLSKKEQSVKRLEEVLNKQKTAFNFVGLSNGFENLLMKKINARKW